MPDGRMELYRRFLDGEPGTCIFTGVEDCHAFTTEDEIEAAPGSRHYGDTEILGSIVLADREEHARRRFAWITPPPEIIGYVSDDHIDKLLSPGLIAGAYCDV